MNKFRFALVKTLFSGRHSKQLGKVVFIDATDSVHAYRLIGENILIGEFLCFGQFGLDSLVKPHNL